MENIKHPFNIKRETESFACYSFRSIMASTFNIFQLNWSRKIHFYHFIYFWTNLDKHFKTAKFYKSSFFQDFLHTLRRSLVCFILFHVTVSESASLEFTFTWVNRTWKMDKINKINGLEEPWNCCFLWRFQRFQIKIYSNLISAALFYFLKALANLNNWK